MKYHTFLRQRCNLFLFLGTRARGFVSIHLANALGPNIPKLTAWNAWQYAKLVLPKCVFFMRKKMGEEPLSGVSWSGKKGLEIKGWQWEIKL